MPRSGLSAAGCVCVGPDVAWPALLRDRRRRLRDAGDEAPCADFASGAADWVVLGCSGAAGACGAVAATGAGGRAPFLRLRLPRLDLFGPCTCPASGAPASNGLWPESGSLTCLSIRAAQRPFGRSRRLIDFDVEETLTACRQIAKFFLTGQQARRGAIASLPPAGHGDTAGKKHDLPP